MTTIATIAANSWSISIGGGWIILMLIGMALCFVFMLGFIWLMHGRRGWAMCGQPSQQENPSRYILTGTFVPSPNPPLSPESEASR
jgi:uncharacterized membrane protein